MDASNPVISSDRIKVSELHKTAGLLRRQNLQHLDLLCNNSRRVFLSEGRAQPETNFLDFGDQYRKGGPPIATGNLDLSFLENLGTCAVDDIQHEHAQIHPPGKNMSKGLVSVQKTFGSPSGIDTILASGAASQFDLQDMVEARKKVEYSAGDPDGFVNRLRKLTTRQCKSPLSRKEVAAKLKKILPVNIEKLPDWDDFSGLYELVDVTSSSGAGAPYWKSKKDAHLQMYETVLPMVLDAFKSGTEGLKKLRSEHPEFFLSECKNKRDRYETAKLKDKCRPYFNQPYHFSILFSMIMQPFCAALQLWDTSNTYNAYGFSAVNGGLDRMVDKVRRESEKAKETGKPRVIVGCYGDDGKIIHCSPSGRVTCVDPDFSQMDGSVDLVTVQGVCDYIYDAYASVHGENIFWKNVLAFLSVEATNAPFLIDGVSIYAKKTRDGILSGVVGTTLFDTAKAAIAYSDIREQLLRGTLSLANGDKASRFLLEHHGLEVKAGTWSETIFDIEPEAEMVCANKFLGMQWMRVWVEDRSAVVTVLPEEDWLTLLLVPRNDPESGNKKMSDFARMRRSFDRARGLLTTGAIFNDTVRKALYQAIDEVAGSAIVATVQNGEGKGEFITENITVNQGTVYPTSSGYPSIKWVFDLFREGDGGEMPELYPDLFKETAYLEHIRASQSRTPVDKVALVTVGGEPKLDYNKVAGPDPPPPLSETVQAEGLKFSKPLVPSQWKPTPAKRKMLQDSSEYWANKSIVVTEKGAFVPLDTPTAIAPKTIDGVKPHIGAEVGVVDHVDTELTPVFDHIVSRLRDGKPPVSELKGPDSKSQLCSLLDRNDMTSYFKGHSNGYGQDGVEVNSVTLFVAKGSHMPFMYIKDPSQIDLNPFVEVWAVARLTGPTRYGKLEAAVSQSVIERLLYFMEKLKTPPPVPPRITPSTSQEKNPFMPTTHPLPVHTHLREPRPDRAMETAYMKAGPSFEWSTCVDIDADLHRETKRIEGLTPEVYNKLKQDIIKALTTNYEEKRNQEAQHKLQCPAKPPTERAKSARNPSTQFRGGPRRGPNSSKSSSDRGRPHGRQ